MPAGEPALESVSVSAIATSTRITAADNIRVALYEASEMACELMSQALETSSYNIKVVSREVTSEVANDIHQANADVVLISCALKEGPLSGLTLLRRLTRTNRSLHCVLLLDRYDRDLVVEAFRSGAVGVCERTQTSEFLCKCISCVHSGQVWANSQQMRHVLEALAGGLPTVVTDVKGNLLLTKREQEIVALVAEGMKNREIASALNVSEHTVKNHLFRIFERLGISSRAELILYILGQ